MNKETLIQFWRDANSYQSIDPMCFNIEEYADNWIENPPVKTESEKFDCNLCEDTGVSITGMDCICDDAPTNCG